MAIALFTGLSILVCVFSHTINRRPGNEAITASGAYMLCVAVEGTGCVHPRRDEEASSSSSS